MKPFIIRFADDPDLPDALIPERKRQRGVRRGDGPIPSTSNHAEEKFLRVALSKGDELLRSGWPDFMLLRDGKFMGVEVKRGSDRVSPSQAKMFAALERIGLAVFVWNPAMPDMLTKWRAYRPRRPAESGLMLRPPRAHA